jgi:hypothetical protein
MALGSVVATIALLGLPKLQLDSSG